MVIEISFPRGGRKPPKNQIEKPFIEKKEYDLFGRPNEEKKPHLTRAEKKKAKEKEEPLSKDIEAVSAELITYRSIQDGMVLMGCIREVQKMTLGINLPGRLAGRVMVTQISTPYTELLHKIVDETEPEGYKSLKQIFTVGQCVAVKVINMDGSSEKYRIDLSMMPQDVNSQLSHTCVQVGMNLWGAISSVEEHGYVVDLGINGCRAFLKKNNIDKNKTYVQGEVGWFVVQKCDSTTIATTVVLNSMTEKIEKMKVINDVNLDHLLPGMKVEFTVSQRVLNGLEGKFLNDYTGYINNSHIKTSYETKKKITTGQTLEARILYIMPVTKLTYLTLHDIDIHERGNITDGTLTTCTVLSSAKGGLYVNLGKSNNIKGFVSFRRLKSQLPFNGDMDDFTVLRRDYPNFSKHKCRVLSYDYLEQVYICSLEKDLVQNITYSLNDLKVGHEVTATIKEIQPAGFLVIVDKVQCFIKNTHISDVVLDSYANIKSKYKVGQTVKAKVWMVNIKSNNAQLTMKPSFMNDEKILTTIETAKINSQYSGVVKQITTNGLLIEFFGNVFGWVPKQEMSFENVASPEKMFKIGQVVKCTVLKKESQRLTLSLQPPKQTSKKKLLHLGQHVDAVVTNVTNNGVEVSVNNLNVPAVIPLLHLCQFPDIAQNVANTYKPGDKLSNLVCLNANNRVPVLSLRDTHLYEDNIPDLKTLKINTVLPCSIESVNEKGMFVKAPIKNFPRFVLVPSDKISNIKEVTSEDVKQNQYILAKVTKITKEKKYNKDVVEATCKLNECWNFDLNDSVERLNEYLSHIDRIKTNLKTFDDSLANLHIGEIVTGVVQEKLQNSSYLVDLKNGAKAIVQEDHIKEKINVGSEVKGVILWIDFVKKQAEISLCTKLMTRINNNQDGKINVAVDINDKNHLFAEVLLVKEEFALVVLRGKNAKRQIAFLPTRLHANDLFPDARAYSIGDVLKIVVAKKENGKIIALLKQLIYDTKKSREKLLTPQIQLQESKYVKGTEQSDHSEDETLMQTEEIDKKLKKRKSSESSQNDETETEPKEKSKKRKNSESSQNDELENEDEPKKKFKKRKNSESSVNEEEEIQTDVTEKKKKKNTEPVEDEEVEAEQTETKKKKKKDKKQKANEDETTNEEQTGSNSKKSKKRKNSESSEEVVEEQTEPKKKQKKEQKQKATEAIEPETVEDKGPILSGASNFWNIPSLQNAEEESSGDEDPNEDLLTKQQKKKKLTPAERAEAARIEEERIRKIETELADAEAAPKTADQFDRLLLANPNNSLLWINYMAFHLEATEIEKARAIARKALNAIEFREEQEKLNVWIAFLNLENRYGSNESFSALLEEAVQMNDALSVYLQALNILADSKKITEFTELLTKVSKKFKPEFKMWTSAADACYKCDQKEQARNLMQRALKSLDEKQHVNLLVQFAFMESRYNEPERAEALLEKVLASYPRRVDVWTSYVEMLIKSDRIQIARNVLERAAGQKLPARKMKTIFNKYIQFETKYGDEEKIKKVRELAAHYVKTALK